MQLLTSFEGTSYHQPTHQCKNCLRKTNEDLDDIVQVPTGSRLVLPTTRCLAKGVHGAHEWRPYPSTGAFALI